MRFFILALSERVRRFRETGRGRPLWPATPSPTCRCSSSGSYYLGREGLSLGRVAAMTEDKGAGPIPATEVPPVMKCPFCAHLEDKVVDSRESKEGEVIRRRRECLACGKRFTSYERIDQIPHLVVKKDGRREPFDREKVLSGLLKACQKRPVPVKTLEEIADRVEAMVHETPEREVPADKVGEFLMDRLKELDKVAFVRFASVYRDFKDVDQFMATLKGLLETRE